MQTERYAYVYAWQYILGALLVFPKYMIEPI